MLYNYFTIRIAAAELSQLQEENRKQREQIQEFSALINEVSTRLDRLDESEDRLRDIADIERFSPEEEPPEAGDLLHTGGRILPLGGKGHENIIEELGIEFDRLELESKEVEESLIELINFFGGQNNLFASTPSIWPTRGFLISGFGFRRDPFTKKLRMHEGIDICNKIGTPIITTADGVVIFTGIRTGYGKFVIIDHGYGYITRYGHLSQILVREGDAVKRGDTIAAMGSTGRSLSSHLHYEVHVNGVPVDPMNYILN
jgi:murein DD-endopeptidase MepM/ murein hydrolase activator NlpD